ncbi:MAG: twin-arginine translocase TatA/TatE family subunit [Verrucomicrobiota bacterium]|nr:twin-arginine translocase TatA/TatE family subunit [Verrucomicrobiota bacterium]MDP7048852.1 twin-arginine translocase TatA/TatE family subunit [Verrucomicrobiota bacterium]
MPEILLVLAVILIFFGAKKLPELAKGMGQGIKEFKKATRDVNNELERAMDDQPTHSPPPSPPPSPQITEQSTGKEAKPDA